MLKFNWKTSMQSRQPVSTPMMDRGLMELIDSEKYYAIVGRNINIKTSISKT